MFCKSCGCKLEDGVKFCDRCGNRAESVSDYSSRETVYEGKIHKCPHCGEVLNSFVSNCPICGYELRNVVSSSSIKEFKEQLEYIEKQRFEQQYHYKYKYKYINQDRDENKLNDVVNKQKIDLISNYPIPNTKEDIIEFMVLACSNFDEKQYLSHLSEEDASDAWLAKIKQCYNKALWVIDDELALNRIRELYLDVMQKIGSSDSSVATDKDVKKKQGFSSWSWPTKIGWIILNIYTYGVPAIVYYFYKRNKENK